ncbi:MAG: tRNA epoxyqueuosine(34) reductase QueG [Anaerolineae bacterium]
MSELIIERAYELGFDLVGIAPAGVAPHAKAYADWIAAGYAGELTYMTRDPDRRSDLRRVLPGAQSVIVVGLSYYTLDVSDEIKNDPSRGLISRYAWGVDYHDLMTPRLKELAEFVQELHPERNAVQSKDAPTRVYVDTGPVLERDWALSAGLGFIGKNTCLINSRMGSWLFLGVIITTAALTPTPSPRPSPNRGEGVGCGSCTRCQSACPTNAFPQPYVLDARRCISYLTIELRGSIPIDLRPLMGNHIFGCDVCQDVCPWPTRFARPTKERAFFAAEIDRVAPRLIDLASLSEAAFQQRFAGTPILRSKRRGLLRNVAVALGNWGSDEARYALRVLAADPDPIIAEHAQWGLTR